MAFVNTAVKRSPAGGIELFRCKNVVEDTHPPQHNITFDNTMLFYENDTINIFPGGIDCHNWTEEQSGKKACKNNHYES